MRPVTAHLVEGGCIPAATPSTCDDTARVFRRFMEHREGDPCGKPATWHVVEGDTPRCAGHAYAAIVAGVDANRCSYPGCRTRIAPDVYFCHQHVRSIYRKWLARKWGTVVPPKREAA